MYEMIHKNEYNYSTDDKEHIAHAQEHIAKLKGALKDLFISRVKFPDNLMTPHVIQDINAFLSSVEKE